MKKYLKLITLLVSFIEIICILSDRSIECFASDASFSPIISRGGQFSSRRAICMLPDSHGYLWIGTLDGLLRYNGTEVKNYNRSVLHTESSSISCIFEDSENKIDANGSFIVSVYCRGLLLCCNDFSSVENFTVHGYDFAEDNFSQMIVGDRNCVYATSANYGLCKLFSGRYNLRGA